LDNFEALPGQFNMKMKATTDENLDFTFQAAQLPLPDPSLLPSFLISSVLSPSPKSQNGGYILLSLSSSRSFGSVGFPFEEGIADSYELLAHL
jgi:hypothetical protein